MLKKKLKMIILAALLSPLSPMLTANGQSVTEMPLYQGEPTVRSSVPTDTAKITIYLPDKKNCGKAVVICPGGGYDHLAINKEGHDWVPFFNRMGITVAVLKYRMPHGDRSVPIADAEQAMKLIRMNAANWGITQVGIMGSSAGGHLASVIATQSTGQAKPDFQILFYPVISMMPDFTHKGSHDNFLGKNARSKYQKQYSSEKQVTRATPRAWVALSDDDSAVLPANSLSYCTELYRHDVPSSLHIYPSGGHGWGYSDKFPYHIEMLLELKSWLESF